MASCSLIIMTLLSLYRLTRPHSISPLGTGGGKGKEDEERKRMKKPGLQAYHHGLEHSS